MKSISTASLVLSLVLAGCPFSPPTGTLDGVVLDVRGAPLADAEVRLDADHFVLTASDGTFSFTVPAGELQRVLASDAGYVTVSRRISITPDGTTSVRFLLQHEAAPLAIEAIEAAVAVTAERGAGLLAAPGSFVHADGTPATGPAEVVLTPFDPSIPEELEAFPGELRGIRTTGVEVILESWGVVDAVVRQGEEILEVAPGHTVELRIPPPGDGRTPPETVATWWHDEGQEAWVEVGEATLDSASGVYAAVVPHLSPFNCDRPIIPGCIRGIVRNAAGDGVPGAQVTALSEPRGTSSFDFTDLDGYYCLYVERNSELTLEIRTPSIEGCPLANQSHGWCVTTRTARSGAAPASSAYPQSCNQSCTVLSSIEVGAPDPGPNPPACMLEPATHPFGSICGDALTSLFECWAPMGTCEYAITENPSGEPTMTLEYMNGATAQSSADPFAGYVMVYTNAAGLECGRVASALGGGVSYTLADGRSLEVQVADDGTTTVSCQGRTETLTAAQLDLLGACAPSATTIAGAMPTGAGGCTAREGTLNGSCRLGSLCDGDLECCNRVGDRSTCQPNGLCEALCDSDSDCSSDTICCAVAGYTLCVPPTACVAG